MSLKFLHDMAMQALIDELETVGAASSEETALLLHTIHLPRSVVTEEGYAKFHLCPDTAVYRFALGLGPSNAKRLAEFLLTLPAEEP